jgi:hypothetical protein
MSVDSKEIVDSALHNFLNEFVAIPQGARSKASTSQNYLRNALRGKADKDNSFPILLKTKDWDYLGGSFARYTKIWPLDDIDLYIPLDGTDLAYLNNGYRLPYKVTTDEQAESNRLLTARWMDGQFISSAKVLSGFREAVKETYSQSIVTVQAHCVTLSTTVASSSEHDGIGFDIVPCFQLTSDDGADQFYLVPNAVGGWMRSNPRLDTEICEELHSYNNKKYRKVVRLIKYWNQQFLDNSFGSYYLELAVSKKFTELMVNKKIATSILGGLNIGFKALVQAYKAGPLTSLVKDAPYVEGPSLSTDQLELLLVAEAHTDLAFKHSLVESTIADAFSHLNCLFESDFFA